MCVGDDGRVDGENTRLQFAFSLRNANRCDELLYIFGFRHVDCKSQKFYDVIC